MKPAPDEKAFIELRKPANCGECHFLADHFDFDADEHYESCRAVCFAKSPYTDPKRLYDGDYKDGCYATPDWCPLTPADEFTVKVPVPTPAHCAQCNLFCPLEEDDEIESYSCYAVYLLDLERMVEEDLFDAKPETRCLTETEFKAKKRPPWCPLKTKGVSGPVLLSSLKKEGSMPQLSVNDTRFGSKPATGSPGKASEAKTEPAPTESAVAGKTAVPQIFTFEENQVRVILRDGEPWWVLSDVCKALGLADANMTSKRVDPDCVCNLQLQARFGVGQNDQKGVFGPQTMILVNEPGLYSVIMRSDKPEAKRFQKWVFGEVLPRIRKTGSYSANAAPELPDWCTDHEKTLEYALDRVRDIKKLTKEKTELSERVAKIKTWFNSGGEAKLRFANKVLAEDAGEMSGEETCKYLKLGVGVIRFYEQLREWGYLCTDAGMRTHPTQRAVECGYIRLGRARVEKDGNVSYYSVPRFTAKGRLRILDKYIQTGMLPDSPEAQNIRNELKHVLESKHAA